MAAAGGSYGDYHLTSVDMSRWYPSYVSAAPAYEPRDYPPRDYAPRDYAPRDYAPRDYAPRDYEPRDYAPRDYEPRDYAPRDYTQRDYPPPEYPLAAHPPREYVHPRYPDGLPISRAAREPFKKQPYEVRLPLRRSRSRSRSQPRSRRVSPLRSPPRSRPERSPPRTRPERSPPRSRPQRSPARSRPRSPKRDTIKQDRRHLEVKKIEIAPAKVLSKDFIEELRVRSMESAEKGRIGWCPKCENIECHNLAHRCKRWRKCMKMISNLEESVYGCGFFHTAKEIVMGLKLPMPAAEIKTADSTKCTICHEAHSTFKCLLNSSVGTTPCPKGYETPGCTDQTCTHAHFAKDAKCSYCFGNHFVKDCPNSVTLPNNVKHFPNYVPLTNKVNTAPCKFGFEKIGCTKPYCTFAHSMKDAKCFLCGGNHFASMCR